MLNPCCCISPRIGTFVFAIVDLLLSVSYLIDIIRVIHFGHTSVQIWFEFAIVVLFVFLALLLLASAIKQNPEYVRQWLFIWIVFILVAIAFQIYNAIENRSSQDRLPINRVWASFPALLLFIYEIWVVYAYLLELQGGPSALTYCPAKVT